MTHSDLRFFAGAGEENRTPVFSLGSARTAVESELPQRTLQVRGGGRARQ